MRGLLSANALGALSSKTSQVLGAAVGVYYLTSLVVLLAFAFGFQFVIRSDDAAPVDADMLGATMIFDARWYKQIAAGGYFYNAAERSNVAFFPLYPLLARFLAGATGLRLDLSLLLVSNVSFVLSLHVLSLYMSARSRTAPPEITDTTILVLSLWPAGLFFRLPYSESTFLLVVAMLFYASGKNWPTWCVAFIAGLATTARPVGIAALAPLAFHICRRRAGARQRAVDFLFFLPVGCWGLLAFMFYQYAAFGEPFAFAKTQRHWQIAPRLAWPDKLLDLATLGPIRAVYDPSSITFWATREMHGAPWCSMQFANPIAFLASLGFVAYGFWRRWLTGAESAMGLLLLLIPYATRGSEMGMASMARYTAVVFPVHIVAAHMLHALPDTIRASIVALGAALLLTYTSLFAAGYLVF